MTEEPEQNLPTLAVVGHVNKGKSSVIATLTENESVKISPKPFTTTEVVEYTVRLHGEKLFRILDTPGFEEARRLLHWLTTRESDASQRRARILDFLHEFDGTEEFIVERRLLRPIMEGAAVLYVVNGTQPYRTTPYEAEMDVLRRTGQPGIALINCIGDDSHVDDWRAALKQYFDLVRPFNAHHATFEERMRLLDAVGTLRDEWHEPLQRAIASLRADREERLDESAEVIARMLIAVETLQLSQTMEGERPQQREKKALEQRFHQRIREIERETHRDIDRIYGHTRLRQDGADLEIDVADENDLFDEGTWKAMGLSPQSEIGLYAATGAGLGLAADAAVGGLSGGAGALFGGITGAGVGALRVGQRFAEAGTPGGFMKALTGSAAGDGQKLTIGPHPSANLPFVLLNRAFSRADAVRNWAHARQEFPIMQYEKLGDLRERLDAGDKRELGKLFGKLRSQAPEPRRSVREDTYELVRKVVRSLSAS